MSTSQPIFVAGANRSGTSLMYALLATHPNISMVQRTDMWRMFYQRYGDLSNQNNFERCLSTMLRYRRLTRLTPNPDRIRKEFRQGESTYGRLFALFHEHHAERLGKQRWGDKSLHTEYYADQVFAEFPQAKMIHVVRDPRDRYASALKRFNSGVASATGRWLSSIRVAKRSLRRYPDRYMVVRYETLASRPEDTLRRICDFLNEEYSPEMLTMQGAPEHLAQKGDSAFAQIQPGEISTGSIGRFRKVISNRDVAFVQVCARQDMAEFDYPSESVQFSLGDWPFFYLIDLPIRLTRMTGWFALEKFRDMKGRAVPARRLVEGAPSV